MYSDSNIYIVIYFLYSQTLCKKEKFKEEH